MAQTVDGKRAELAAPPTAPATGGGDYNTAMVHLYRAEVTKTNTWRQRLDTTTNWAVVTSGAAISFALGDQDLQRHVVILLTSLMVTLFLFLEARRYRHYDVWQTRVHLLEGHFFAPMLTGETAEPSTDWKRLLAADLRVPRYHIPFREALGWRLRRNYVWLYAILLLTWLAKIALHPATATSMGTLVARAAIGPLPGWLVLTAGLLFDGGLIAIALVTWSMQTTAGEIVTPKRTRDRILHNAADKEPVHTAD
jgi:uncharacterized membrane protein